MVLPSIILSKATNLYRAELVFYLSPDQLRLLHGRYLAWARENPPAEEWRGWSWNRGPIEPPYEDIRLTLSEVAGQFCETGRDIYLKRVERIKRPPSEKMLRGRVLHMIVERAITKAKIFLYSEGRMSGKELLRKLSELREENIKEVMRQASPLGDAEFETLSLMARRLWDYETIQISASLDRAISSNPWSGIDALVNSAIPFVVEMKVDGSFLGLSERLSIDALSSSSVILDLKTGKGGKIVGLAAAGYALCLEASRDVPVDVGVIVSLSFDKDGFPLVERKMLIIDEVLRREFIDERDRKMRIVAEEQDPGLPPFCPRDCIYWDVCRGGV